MKFKLLLCLFFSLLNITFAVEIENAGSNTRESRKLFGGYKITPKFCKATRNPSTPMGGPSICMFNHECSQRSGQVVGACMDGFLFGACCQLPAGSTGELIESELMSVVASDNNLSSTSRPHTTSMDITSSGVSQITAALLHPGVLPTAQDNAVVQIGNDQAFFSTPGVITHQQSADTVLLNHGGNEINPSYFKPTSRPVMEDRKTTLRVEDTTVAYSKPIVHISISNAPSMYTPSPGFHRPMFRPKPKPNQDQYVLVPTISHDTNKPNKTQEFNSIVNILQMLNQSSTVPSYDRLSTTRKPPSTSYVFSVTSTRRPGYEPEKSTSKKPPSTSYVFSTTIPPRKTTPKKRPTTTRKPTRTTNKKPQRRPAPTTNSYGTGYSTVANSASAFSTTKPPSTSYVYSPLPTRRPPSTIDSHIAGPGFTVTSKPTGFSPFPSPAPTVIVLAPVTEESSVQKPSTVSTYQSNGPTQLPQRKPINHVTINNHVTQNIYSTSERPSPTVLITPKPSISSSMRPQTEFITSPVELEPSVDELINFPPVRNPNLNMSNPTLNDDDITTPAFIEDDALNDKMESFVNKIIQGLQEPFEGLKDIVYNRNKTASSTLNTSNTTRKPTKKQGTTTKKPRPGKPATSTVKTTTRRTTSKRPSNVTTRRPQQQTTTKKSKTTKKPVTTTQSFIEEDNGVTDSDEYRNQCGIRPLMKTGRIVGGKGATFGEFPWQVLVRESTWLGLFTKNKCGGVLISNKYVMTAAHCQPGFLASLVAVFGEFDISGDLETKRHISRNVKRVIVHRQYDAATFENDLALLELESPVQFDSHIVPICLPREGEDFTGRMATVTGWGRLKYGGGVPSVLQEVQVPIMENHVCQEMFRTAGHSKVILESFLCAGYANGQKDSCEGDSGGPLVLQRPDGRYQLAGTVSHGIKCAAPYLPGVYMRTTYYKPWITSITGIN